MIAMNREMFDRYTQEDREVLIEFWAPWCVYCRRIAPALERIAQEQEGSLTVAQVNIDDEPELAAREQIEVIPTLVLYRGGQALGSIVAPESRERIEEFIHSTRGA